MEYCIGIDLGGTFIKSGIVSREGELVDSLKLPTGVEANSTEVILENMKDSVRKLLDKNKLKIKAIGVGVPGIADENGNITIFSNIKVFDNYPMAKELSIEFGIPVFVDNDANNAAIGEFLFGAAKGLKNFIVITIGTGIGGGIFIDGHIYHGKIGAAGEVGHMLISPDGRQCGCGNYGCWESFASATAIVKKCQSLIRKGIKTSLIKYYPDGLSARVIVEEAKAGDKVALEIFDEMCKYLGIGIANLVNIFNPEAFIVGGGVSLAGDFLFERLRFYTGLYSVPFSFKDMELKPAMLGDNSGVLGSAALAFTSVYKVK